MNNYNSEKRRLIAKLGNCFCNLAILDVSNLRIYIEYRKRDGSMQYRIYEKD